MLIPSKKNPKWAELVTGKSSHTLKFLAGKIALTKLIGRVKADPGGAAAAAEELQALYAKNADKPSVHEDIKAIFG